MKVVTDAAVRESVLNSSAFITAMGWIEASKVSFNSVNGEAFIREFEQTISAPSATVVIAFLESFSVMLDIVSTASGIEKQAWRDMACAGFLNSSQTKNAVAMNGRYQQFGGHNEETIMRFKASNVLCAALIMRAFYFDLFFIKSDLEEITDRIALNNNRQQNKDNQK